MNFSLPFLRKMELRICEGYSPESARRAELLCRAIRCGEKRGGVNKVGLGGLQGVKKFVPLRSDFRVEGN